MLNLYGDKKIVVNSQHGVDIAQQRCDELDQECLNFVRDLKSPSTSTITVLDLACGVGGQTARLAKLGAKVIGFDFPNMGPSFNAYMAQVEHGSEWNSPSFLGGDMRLIPTVWRRTNYQAFDAIICQRAIHYLPHVQAQELLGWLRTMLKPDGRFFLSVSGIHSELCNGYEHKDMRPEQRFCVLSNKMQEIHNIKQPVCLYSEDELSQLVQISGWDVERIYTSSFGNIKSILKIR